MTQGGPSPRSAGPKRSSGRSEGSTKPDALPTQVPGNVATAQFECIVPITATPARRARISLYGHGLLGSRAEVKDSWVQALATNPLAEKPKLLTMHSSMRLDNAAGEAFAALKIKFPLWM